MTAAAPSLATLSDAELALFQLRIAGLVGAGHRRSDASLIAFRECCERAGFTAPAAQSNGTQCGDDLLPVEEVALEARVAVAILDARRCLVMQLLKDRDEVESGAVAA